MQIKYLAALPLLLASNTLHADAIGGKVGLNLWAQEYDARAQKGGKFVDFDSSFDIDDESDYQLTFELEHPIPLVPNFRAQHTKSATQGDGVIELTSFNGVELEGAVVGELDLTHTDIGAYYEVLDNNISVDIGVAIRVFDASVSLVAENGGSTTVVIDDVNPMIYAAAQFELPFTGWYLKAEGNFIEWDGDGIVDVTGGLGWESSIGLGVELGYRYMDIDYSFGSTVLDATSQGVYGGLFWDF